MIHPILLKFERHFDGTLYPNVIYAPLIVENLLQTELYRRAQQRSKTR